ncbi:DUF6602 domain-containing protein [Streptomyces sp. NPDC059618]|uniref:DUF6602 domain-containing protein n=1 Tax=Streptomyces sp. NPDC059618 TaxID=3346887 RepID=UPI0036B25AAD
MSDSDFTLAAILKSVAQKMAADFQQSKIFKHRGEAGGTRETLVAQFLDRYLSGQNIALHSAEAIAVGGDVSPQCDVLIVDSQTPPFTTMEEYRVVPIECVHGVLEVKTRLTKTELIDACEKISAVKRMEKRAYYPDAVLEREARAYSRSYNHFPTVGDIFAFDAIDLDTLGRHLAEWCRGRDCSTVPDGVWVLGKGYFQWETEDGRLSMRATNSGRLVRIDPWEETDVLYPMLMSLSINYGEAWMRRINLLEYAKSAPLGKYVTRWQVSNQADAT